MTLHNSSLLSNDFISDFESNPFRTGTTIILEEGGKANAIPILVVVVP